MSSSFSAGVLRIIWTDDAPSSIPDRDGRVFQAVIAECATTSGSLLRDLVRPALHNLVVRAPDGTLSRVTGVESFASMGLRTEMPIGLLLVPVDER